MDEGFISLKHRVDCYHCNQAADQVITAVPYRADVVCDNCGATRVFIPRNEDVAGEGAYNKPECYDTWKLEQEAVCRNCSTKGLHDLTIGCRRFIVRCRACGFTHLYRFDLEYIDKKPRE